MKRDTRRAILDMAKTLFSQQGYNAVSIGEIAGALGISKGNVTYHFKRKEDIMEALLAEAGQLADSGVKELIVIAQDITRYGMDLEEPSSLAQLLKELCKLDFHWIRLHYLYPEVITDELIDTIAREKKIVHYLDIPIQHCSDGILKAMRRRNTRAELEDLFARLRRAIPDLVVRTSLICGLPGEGEAEFEELCQFLREQKLQRVGVFQFSPEEGTLAAAMEDQVDPETAARRVELVVELAVEPEGKMIRRMILMVRSMHSCITDSTKYRR